MIDTLLGLCWPAWGQNPVSMVAGAIMIFTKANIGQITAINSNLVIFTSLENSVQLKIAVNSGGCKN